MQLSLDDIAAWTNATSLYPPLGSAGVATVIDRVVIDSRVVAPGDLFVAVIAERDGHDYAQAALDAGAAAVLASRPLELRQGSHVGATVIEVDNTVDALTRMGVGARGRIEGPVIGITGSVGKTSTKDLLASVCAQAGVTTASEKSLNNELGVPLTLVNARAGTERTIVEIGARGIGHIAHLCAIASPNVAVVTAVAHAHTELFGSIDAVATAKGELVESLGRDGLAVLNADDERVAAMAGRTDATVVTYGTNGSVRAEGVTLDTQLRAQFEIVSDWGRVAVRLGVAGLHNVSNALAAASVALHTGVTPEQVVTGLGDAELSPSRMALHRLHSGGIVIDDAYNANPTSMLAALDSLSALDVDRRVAVLGYMAELGDEAPALHREIAQEARTRGIEVVAVGTDLYGVAGYGDAQAAMDGLDPPTSGEAVLIKASRVAGLERIAQRWLG